MRLVYICFILYVRRVLSYYTARLVDVSMFES